MPKPGDILFYENYKFDDGSKKDKLFVVLNNADVDTPCLVLITTSQSERYTGVKQGCNQAQKVFYVPKTCGEWFQLDTYIQLPRIFEIPTGELLDGKFKHIISIKSSISSECLAQLKNCLKKFKDDVSERNWKPIFHS